MQWSCFTPRTEGETLVSHSAHQARRLRLCRHQEDRTRVEPRDHRDHRGPPQVTTLSWHPARQGRRSHEHGDRLRERPLQLNVHPAPGQHHGQAQRAEVRPRRGHESSRGYQVDLPDRGRATWGLQAGANSRSARRSDSVKRATDPGLSGSGAFVTRPMMYAPAYRLRKPGFTLHNNATYRCASKVNPVFS
jgi:hypothetical protein